ncbi:MAG: hypothetical protein QXU67_03225 [Candidatus Bathyarchaeia archaeon]
MPINIAHTIGTLALLGMLVVVSFSFAMVTTSLRVEVTKEQLTAIGEYIALHLVEMATLVEASNLDYNYTGKIMVRNITIPPDIQGNVYLIEIITSSSKQCFVRLSLLSRRDISIDVPIPIKVESQTIILSTRLLPSLQEPPEKALYSSSGEVFQFAIWGYRIVILDGESRMEISYIGIGRWERPF